MRLFLYCLLILLSTPAIAEQSIVYGEGFAFGTVIPQGWECACGGKDPTTMNAAAAFFKKDETTNLIYIQKGRVCRVCFLRRAYAIQRP